MKPLTLSDLQTLQWHTLRELSARWARSTETITRWIESGTLTARMFAGRYRVHADAVREFERRMRLRAA